jgi:hypothetical protein
MQDNKVSTTIKFLNDNYRHVDMQIINTEEINTHINSLIERFPLIHIYTVHPTYVDVNQPYLLRSTSFDKKRIYASMGLACCLFVCLNEDSYDDSLGDSLDVSV